MPLPQHFFSAMVGLLKILLQLTQRVVAIPLRYQCVKVMGIYGQKVSLLPAAQKIVGAVKQQVTRASGT